MVTHYLKHLFSAATPQRAKARADQVQNNAGGWAFAVDCWTRFDRFLILGSEGGTYYAGERELTIENAGVVEQCMAMDGEAAVARIVRISEAGRAPKNDPAILALAIGAANPELRVRRAALSALPQVCRTGTHLLHFAAAVQQTRAWGRALRRAVGGWYNNRPAAEVAMQVAKYAQRDGWAQRDLLRLSHPKPATAAHDAVYRWVTGQGSKGLAASSVDGRPANSGGLPEYLVGFEELRKASTVKEVVELIRVHGFTHEMIPTEWKNETQVWSALLERMPMTAMVRNLGKMTEVGAIGPLSHGARLVCSRLRDTGKLKAARIHPLAVLMALRTYQQGQGVRGSLRWKPVSAVVDALNDAFYACFSNVRPTGRNILVALDVSGSMTGGQLSGMPGMTPRVGSAAMAMVTARTERNWHMVGFSNTLVPVGLKGSMSLQDVIDTIDRIPMGGTDCALPMVVAKRNRWDVDTFVIYTDNETWAGGIHPYQALREYRQAAGRAAKLIVVGMTSTGFSIADPTDAGMLDVVGFDAAAPAVMADFVVN